MKRILVTGGAGFIGSHLCERLVNEGNDVICLDNFYSGSKENVWHLIGKPNFELVRHDVVNPYWAEVDEIYNLACPASPIYYQNDPIQTTKTSVFGAYHMLGLARRTKAKILQSSTSEVYGDPNVHPQPETYWGNVNPIGLRSCYDEGKRCAETLFFDYHRLHGVRTKVIRIFNTYGPRMAVSDGRVVSNFVHLWRRSADPFLPVRQRPHRGHVARHGHWRRLHGACQSGQSWRVHHAGAGREGHQEDWRQ